MGFTRKWDTSCPRVWDSWEMNNLNWIIQDLAPEDDDEALEILIEHLLPDETLCILSKVKEDPESLSSITEFWRASLAQRMSLGCYKVVGGKKTLAGLNVCVVDSVKNRFPADKIKGAAWRNVYEAMEYLETKCDPFKYLGLDQILHAIGLVVKTEYRGSKLGSRILAAREPLCKSLGIKATATAFTGPASQKSALRSGFETICVVSLQEYRDQGLNYPADENRVIKLMIKRYTK